MYKTILFCSLLVGSLKAMTIGPTFQDRRYNKDTIVDLGDQISDEGRDFETPSGKFLTWDVLTFLFTKKTLEEKDASKLKDSEE